MSVNWTWGRAHLINNAARWTDIPGSSFTFTMVDDNDSGVTTNGDGNEIGWINNVNAPAGNPLAVTSLRYTLCSDCNAGPVLEADIRFYERNSDGSARTWLADPGPLDQSDGLPGISLPIVASHELGHAMSLQHSNSGMARMESHAPAGGWFHDTVAATHRVTPLARDVIDASFVYPQGGVWVSSPDVVLVNHQDSGVSDPSGTVPQSMPLSFDPATGDIGRFPRNRVIRNGDASRKTVATGDTVDIRICAQNRGAQAFSAQVPIQIRLSTNTVISTADTETGNGWVFLNGTFPATSVVCTNISFTVPNVPAGVSYIVGLQINTSGALDVSTSDNTTIINRRIIKI